MIFRGLDIALFCLYTAASVAGLIIIKLWLPSAQLAWRSGGFGTLPTFLVGTGALLYIASFLLWLAILSRNELSVAYPVAIGLTLVFSSVAAKVVLHEPLAGVKTIGISVIFLGVWLVSRPQS